MEPISYKQEMGDTERICSKEDPLHLAQFHLGILRESILFHCFLYLCDSITLFSGGFFLFFVFLKKKL